MPRKASKEKAIQAVEEAYANLVIYHGRGHPETRKHPTPEDEIHDLSFSEAVSEFDAAVMAAIRSGATSHPRVRAWLDTQCGLGQRTLLRKTKRGLETGVRGPLRLKQQLTAEDQRIVDLHMRGLSAAAIVRALGLKISRQAVQKRLNKLGYGGRRPRTFSA